MFSRALLITTLICIPTIGISQIIPLDVRPVDAAYSNSLDAIVMVSAGPSRLTIWDTKTRAVRAFVPLVTAPTTLAISVDGRTAAVGHDGRISVVNLATASIVKVLNVSCEVLSIALAPNGWVYVLPRRDQWTYIRSVNIDTGIESQAPTGGIFYAGSLGKLAPDGRSVYIAQNGISPDHMQKYDVTTGPIKYLYDWPYHGDYSACGNLWMSPDTLRVFTRCGNVFRVSDVRTQDMTYNGKLALNGGGLVSVAVSVGRDRIVTLQATNLYSSTPSAPGPVESSVFIYGYQNLNPIMRVGFPQFQVLSRSYGASGQFVFLNSTADKWFAVVQADPSAGLLNDYGVVSGSLEITATHSASLNVQPLAPDQIATAFLDVNDLATAVASTNPAPDSLANVYAKVLGSDGVERTGRMLYAGPGQVNFIVPSGVPDGAGKLYIDILPSIRKVADITVQRVSPGIFTARGDGSGPPAGLALRVKSTGDQILQYLFQRGSGGTIVTNPVYSSGSANAQQEQVYLLLFGTGIRSAKSVRATIGGISVPVAYAAQSETDGLDQLNLGPLPADAARLFGDQQVIVVADSVQANVTTVRIQ